MGNYFAPRRGRPDGERGGCELAGACDFKTTWRTMAHDAEDAGFVSRTGRCERAKSRLSPALYRRRYRQAAFSRRERGCFSPGAVLFRGGENRRLFGQRLDRIWLNAGTAASDRGRVSGAQPSRLAEVIVTQTPSGDMAKEDTRSFLLK